MRRINILRAVPSLLCAAALLIPPAAEQAGAEAEALLSFGHWTDEATGCVSLSFDPDGRGDMDGLPFVWETEDGRLTLRFMPECALGAAEELAIVNVCGSIKLRSSDALYIPGQAFDRERELAEEGRAVAEQACKYVGYAYRYGGKTPETGFDCSGLVYYVYSLFGYELPRVAADQAAAGEHVEPWELRSGDILCFKSGSRISHAGIYIGGRQFVHAESSETGVVIGELAGRYEDRGYEARRIVGSNDGS